MVGVAIGLIIIGSVAALAGLRLFRIVLPLVGFASGLAVGFSGVQAVFGNGAISTTIAVLVAVITAALMAVLSFLFFEIAVVVLSVIVGISLMSSLAIAIGLGDNGFILFMLSLSGALLGLSVASSGPLSRSLVITVTSFLGVSFVLAGAMLIAGSVSLDQLNDGIVRTVVDVVDQEFAWLIALLGGSLLAINIQRSTPDITLLSDEYEFKEAK